MSKIAYTSPVAPKYLPTLARTFTPVVMNGLINNGQSRYLSEVINSSEIFQELDMSINFGDFFEWLYTNMSESYRNEYIYKNAIVNKILLGKHSLNSSAILTEVRVGNCKADVVILNGTSTVYEIKSEYDSLDRLNSQIHSYLKMFDMTNVISSRAQLAKLEDLLPPEVGLMELTQRYTIRTVREPTSVKSKVSPEVIFGSLRKPEYLSIIARKAGYIPDVPNTRIYKECLHLFSKLSPEIAHDEMVRVLYQRGDKKTLREFILGVPPSLRAFVISSKLSIDKANRLNELLNTPLQTVLSLAC